MDPQHWVHQKNFNKKCLLEQVESNSEAEAREGEEKETEETGMEEAKEEGEEGGNVESSSGEAALVPRSCHRSDHRILSSYWLAHFYLLKKNRQRAALFWFVLRDVGILPIFYSRAVIH
jgi:hypothetical protein